MALTARPLALAFDSPDSAGVIRLMAVSLAIFGFSIVPAARLQREFRQGLLFAVNGTGLLASVTTMTSLALLGFGPASLAWAQIASQSVVAIAMFAVTRTRLRLGFDRAIAAESATFCLPLAFANLLSWLLLSVDNLIVARVMTPQQLGFYVLAFNVSSWPMSAIGQSIRVIALPGFSRAGDQSVKNRALLLATAPIWTVSVVAGAALAAAAPAIVVMLYGQRWSAAAVPLVGLAVFGALRVVFDLLATFLIAVGRTFWVLLVQVAWLVAMVPVMLVAVSRFGLAGAGWAHVVVAVAVVAPAYLLCLHKIGIDVRSYLHEFAVPAVAVVPTAAACWLAVTSIDRAAVAFLVATACTLALYVLPMARWWLRRITLLRRLEPVSSAPMEVST